jgi:hypothetical protein
MHLTVSSRFLISSGWGGGGAMRLCYLTTLRGGMGPETYLRYPFKVTRGLLYIKPPIYTYKLYAPCVRLLMRAASITWASGRGLGPGISTFLGPKWHSPIIQLDAISQDPKKVLISRAQLPPSPSLPRNGCYLHQKH